MQDANDWTVADCEDCGNDRDGDARISRQIVAALNLLPVLSETYAELHAAFYATAKGRRLLDAIDAALLARKSL